MLQLWREGTSCPGMSQQATTASSLPRKGEVHQLQSSEPVGEEEDAPGSKQTYNLFKLGASEPMRVSVKANNVTLVEVDTGAAASVISKKTYERLWRYTTRPALKPSDMLLQTYTGERLNICGMISLNVE